MPASDHSIPHHPQDKESINSWLMAELGVYAIVRSLDSSPIIRYYPPDKVYANLICLTNTKTSLLIEIMTHPCLFASRCTPLN